tara:strand:- start:98 stop:601 length:504 start_codon:yes stop_codon:yes gene_type:complete
MMRKILIATVSLGALVCVSASAATIGFVSLSNLAPKMQKVAEQKWQKQYGEKANNQAELFKKSEDDFKKAVVSYQKKYKLMSADMRKKTEQVLQGQQHQLQVKMADLQKAHFQQQQKISSEMLADIKAQAVKLGKASSYDLVVFKASILYQDQKDSLVDITSKIKIS